MRTIRLLIIAERTVEDHGFASDFLKAAVRHSSRTLSSGIPAGEYHFENS
jgi:hypothetical protein